MRRRDFLGLLAVSAAEPFIGADKTGSSDTQFFVSPNGNDAADGRTPGTALRTISAVNDRLRNRAIRHPAAVLFERGQTFFGKLRAPADAPTGNGYLTFGAYGPPTQPKPAISSYVDLSAPSAWRPTGSSVWSADLSGQHPGYDGAQGGRDNIGFLKVDGAIHGRRVWKLEDLRQPWDFHCTPNTVHVFAPANPAIPGRRIHASTDGDCITVGNAVKISDLVLTGSGGHGVAGSATDLVVSNNEFVELGGSHLYGTTRYGNGFQSWINSARVTVTGNVFHDIYDVALTAQGDNSGSAGPATGGWADLVFRDNLIYLCNQSIELWSQGRTGTGFRRVLIEGNTCLYAGYGWSSELRPDRDTRVHLLTYGWDLPADVTVRRNIFYDASLAYRYSAVKTPGLRCSDNLIAQRPGRRLKVNQPQTVPEATSWVAAEANDQGSRFETVPAQEAVNVAAAIAKLRR